MWWVNWEPHAFYCTRPFFSSWFTCYDVQNICILVILLSSSQDNEEELLDRIRNPEKFKEELLAKLKANAMKITAVILLDLVDPEKEVAKL